MCHIAGYIGDKNAAPILIEMLKDQAGFCGGYYTGISTIHNGKMYTTKVIGDVDTLLKKTDAINFPGNIGIIHSRSKSGGDVHWAHPFNSNDNRLSTVFNGALRKYEKLNGHDDLINEISSLDVNFESAVSNKIGTYPRLKNGKCVHVSECLCHLTKKFIQEGLSTHLALRKSLLIYPSEIVGLALNLDQPTVISYVNHNMPMFIGKTKNEIFLSSIALTFPNDRNYLSIEKLPHSSSGEITIDKVVMEEFPQPLKIGEITEQIMLDANNVMLEKLKTSDNPCTIRDLIKCVNPLFGDLIPQSYPVVYEVLRKMKEENIIEIIKTVCDGAEEAISEGIKTVQFSVKLK